LLSGLRCYTDTAVFFAVGSWDPAFKEVIAGYLGFAHGGYVGVRNFCIIAD
jgi:hypothetical protein